MAAAPRATRFKTRGYARWGTFEPATVTACRDGYYCICYANDKFTAWQVAGELIFAAHSRPRAAQLSRLEPGAGVVLPVAPHGYLHASFLKIASEGRAEVQLPTQEKSAIVDVADIRLPIASGVTLGECQRLAVGTEVFALRGQWCDAAIDRVSPTLGWHATVHAAQMPFKGTSGPYVTTRSHSAWLDGGRLSGPHQVAAQMLGGAGGPSLLQLAVGGRVVVPEPATNGDASSSAASAAASGSGARLGEAELLDIGGFSARVQLARGGEAVIPLEQVHVRLTESLRCVCASGGFQRGVVREISPAEGVYRVSLVGDAGERWVSAGELTTRACILDPARQACSSGCLVAILPKPSEAPSPDSPNSPQQLPADADLPPPPPPRWLPAARCATDTLLSGTRLQRFQRLAGQRGLTVRVTRKNGKYGMGHDEHNLIVVVHPDSAAADAGLRVGDAVRSVNGVPLTGLLTAALQGKEVVTLEVDPCEAEADSEWLVGRERLLLPALSRHVDGGAPINVGDECYVLVGGWSEAIVAQRRSDGLSMLELGGRMRRLASSGEIAWHDASPMVRDVADGMALLGWNEGVKAFQCCVAVGTTGGDEWRVKFDDGEEQSLSRDLLRKRWASPTRVLALWGDYFAATVVDVLAGTVLRLDFGGSDFRWALHDEILQTAQPPAAALEDLAAGTLVACALNNDNLGGYRRAKLLSYGASDGTCKVMFENGEQAIVGASELRLPRSYAADVKVKPPKVGTTV